MVSLDTNVLVRVCHDDSSAPCQTRAARNLVQQKAQSEGVFVALPALIETVWVLRSHYKVDKADVMAFIQGLLAAKGVKVDEEALVAAALIDWKRGTAGFVDYLILNRSQLAGCSTTVTFEKRKMAVDVRVTTLEGD